jgi:flagellar assembly protein FliH
MLSSPEPAVSTPTLFEVAGGASVPESLLAEARASARAAGYAAGWAAGMQAATVRSRAEADRARAAAERDLAVQRDQVARAVAALDSAAAHLEQRAVPAADDIEALVITSALAIAEALLGHALADDGIRAPAALARVLRLAPSDEPVVVRLSVADHAVLSAPATPRTARRDVTLVADASLADGDAVATSGALLIDGRLQAGVRRVEEALGCAPVGERSTRSPGSAGSTVPA